MEIGALPNPVVLVSTQLSEDDPKQVPIVCGIFNFIHGVLIHDHCSTDHVLAHFEGTKDGSWTKDVHR